MLINPSYILGEHDKQGKCAIKINAFVPISNIVFENIIHVHFLKQASRTLGKIIMQATNKITRRSSHH
ncbi:hypothetical protein Sjap_012194 [Stephania japonica]|uniref:Uncharacterized protein n=1 Tax=Stephania japonica TaxID=461633 RepID=A0AAP0IVG6_9MAGN